MHTQGILTPTATPDTHRHTHTQTHNSASFEGKAGWPCYQLTAKALENIAAGARGSGASHAPPLSAQEQAVQDALTQAHTAAGKAGAGSSSNQHHVSRQALYQQLLAVLLLQYTAKVVSLPESDASQLLARYTAPGDEDDEGQGSPHWQQQGPLVDDAAAAEAGLNSAATTAAACVVYEDVEAAQQDEDSDAYEPLDEVMSHQQQQCSATSGHTQQQQRSEPFSPQALVAKLLSLADHVHYSLLSHEPLWQQQGSSSGGGGGAAQHLLQLLRLLGVHSRSRDLQPLLHACVGVLVDRLAAAPGDLPLLHQLWAALGLTGGAGSALSGGASTCGQRQQQEGLPPEAVLGFTVAAAVWQQLPGVGARRQLWQAMCDDLLPLLEQCTEQLAFSTGTAGMTTAAAAGASFAHMLLVCHIVELLVLGRPAHADVAAQLTQLGVTRNLVTLFVKWGCDAAAEPLRCVCAEASGAAAGCAFATLPLCSTHRCCCDDAGGLCCCAAARRPPQRPGCWLCRGSGSSCSRRRSNWLAPTRATGPCGSSSPAPAAARATHLQGRQRRCTSSSCWHFWSLLLTATTTPAPAAGSCSVRC